MAGLAERIGRYQSAAPGTEVVTASGIDAHNDLVRCAWKMLVRLVSVVRLKYGVSI